MIKRLKSLSQYMRNEVQKIKKKKKYKSIVNSFRITEKSAGFYDAEDLKERLMDLIKKQKEEGQIILSK